MLDRNAASTSLLAEPPRPGQDRSAFTGIRRSGANAVATRSFDLVREGPQCGVHRGEDRQGSGAGEVRQPGRRAVQARHRGRHRPHADDLRRRRHEDHRLSRAGSDGGQAAIARRRRCGALEWLRHDGRCGDDRAADESAPRSSAFAASSKLRRSSGCVVQRHDPPKLRLMRKNKEAACVRGRPNPAVAGGVRAHKPWLVRRSRPAAGAGLPGFSADDMVQPAAECVSVIGNRGNRPCRDQSHQKRGTEQLFEPGNVVFHETHLFRAADVFQRVYHPALVSVVCITKRTPPNVRRENRRLDRSQTIWPVWIVRSPGISSVSTSNPAPVHASIPPSKGRTRLAPLASSCCAMNAAEASLGQAQ